MAWYRCITLVGSYICGINFYIQLLLIVVFIFVIVCLANRSQKRGTYKTDYDFHSLVGGGGRGGRGGGRGGDRGGDRGGGCQKKHERRCREILEDIFNPHLFPSVRPSFLKNPQTGRNLEIDCYNSSLRIGLEYQGVQHRKYTPWYHRSIDDFRRQVDRDQYKKKRLEEENIFMIYVPDTVKYRDLDKYIRVKLKEM